MELFLELLCTIVFSLLLSFFISKLLSYNPTADHHSHSSSTNHAIDQTCPTFDTGPRLSKNRAIESVIDDDNKSVREDDRTRSLEVCSDMTEISVGGVEDDCVEVVEDKLLDESPDCFLQFTENATELTGDEISVDKEILLDDEDWEGIERTDLDKQFGEAVALVQCRSDLELGSDVDMQLYGLHKVATEGPCRELQPMPFKVSARAKWHAWQKLGNLSPEAAMEQYIKVVSQNIPGWLRDDSAGDGEQGFSDAGTSAELASDLTSVTHNSTVDETERTENEMAFNAGCS